MPIKGTIPVVDENYDLSRPGYTAKNSVGAIIGVGFLFGILAGGRALWNRASQTTDAVGEVDVF